MEQKLYMSVFKKNFINGVFIAKTRNFVVTQWNIDCDYDKLIETCKDRIKYIAYGEEVCPNTGKRHHQMYVSFVNAKNTSNKVLCKIGDLFGPTHCYVKAMKGSWAQNEAYCSKEGELQEHGDKPKQGFRNDIREIADKILSGEASADDVCVDNPEFFHQYGRTLDRLEAIGLRKQFRKWMTKGIWYTGPSGCGKSHTAFKDYSPETHYIKVIDEKFWDGYKGQDTVIINEFRGEIKFSELLDLVDKWPKTVMWKCREAVPFLAKTLIITSIKKPEDIYVNQVGFDEPWRQFTRRFEVIDLELRTSSPNLAAGLEQKCSEGNIRTSEPEFEFV